MTNYFGIKDHLRCIKIYKIFSGEDKPGHEAKHHPIPGCEDSALQHDRGGAVG